MASRSWPYYHFPRKQIWRDISKQDCVLVWNIVLSFREFVVRFVASIWRYWSMYSFHWHIYRNNLKFDLTYGLNWLSVFFKQIIHWLFHPIGPWIYFIQWLFSFFIYKLMFCVFPSTLIKVVPTENPVSIICS